MPEKEDKARRWWFERHPKKALALVLATAFLLLDLGFGHFWCPKTIGQPDAFFHHGLPRSFDGPRNWGGKNYPLVTNSLGFKDAVVREVPRDSPDYRVVLIGDSFTEGVGVPYAETFAGIFGQRAAAERVEVLNAGVLSYSPKLYYLKTRYLLHNALLKFDELIVFVDYTDVQDEIRYEAFIPSTEFGLSRFYLFNRVDSFLKQNSLTYYQFRRLLLERSGYFDDELFTEGSEDDLLVYDQEFLDNWSIERNLWEYNPRVYEKWGERGVALARDNMERLYQLCRENGIRLSVAVYPWPNQIRRHHLDSLQVQIWRQFCDERGLRFFNLFPVFINEENPEQVVADYFITGDVHWNPAGHRKVADFLWQNWRAGRER